MNTLIKIIFAFVLVGVLLLFSAAIFESFLTTKTIVIEVTKTERLIDEKGDVHYFIHTSDEVFKNEDNYYHGKSNQEALMKIMEKGKTYKVQVVGYKWGFKIPSIISKERNIVKIIQ